MKRPDVKKLIPPLAVLFVAALWSVLLGCPMRRLTGLGCPLCGVSRAFLALLRLDLAGAFRFHPLWPALALGLPAVWLLSNRGGRSAKAARMLAWALGALFILCYVLRLALHDPVVWPA